MSVVWLDSPPYVMDNDCRCWPGCRNCTLCDCCCLCQTCPEEQWEEANA